MMMASVEKLTELERNDLHHFVQVYGTSFTCMDDLGHCFAEAMTGLSLDRRQAMTCLLGVLLMLDWADVQRLLAEAERQEGHGH